MSSAIMIEILEDLSSLELLPTVYPGDFSYV